MTRPVMWNYDKPHRCPECHSSAWTYDGEWQPRKMQWWKTYTCPCGARFTGRWAWWPKTYYRVKFAIWRAYRELKWRMTR